MPFPFDQNEMYIPGLESILDTVQNQFWWGRSEQQVWQPCLLSSATVDAGNTVTTTLRGGLLLGKMTTGANAGKLKEWAPTATDGSEVIYGLLPAPISTVSTAGAVADRYTYVMIGGNLLSDNILVPVSAVEGIVGHAQEYNIVSQLHGRFSFDKHVTQGPSALSSSKFRYLTATEIGAFVVTIDTAGLESGRIFLGTGATGTTTLTMPAATVGQSYSFLANNAQSLTIKAASGTFIIPGNVALAASTGITITLGESAHFLGVAAGVYMLVGSVEVLD
jgi:uncharacterized Zn-binding protein involved in type VI secretion